MHGTPLTTRTHVRFRGLAALLLFGGSLTACSESATLTSEREALEDLSRANIMALSTTTQDGDVDSYLPEPLIVEVRSSAGAPLSGVAVEWVFQTGQGVTAGVVGSGSTSGSLISYTDGSGRTAAAWQLGIRAGIQQASAQVLVSQAPTGSQNGASGAPGGYDKGKKVGFTANAKPGSVATLDVTPGEVVLRPGDVLPMVAKAYDAYGNLLSNPNLNWRSSNQNIAVVDAVGRVTALATGNVSISAKSGNVEDSATLTSMSDVSTTMTVAEGQSQTGTVGTALSVRPTVQIQNDQGQPVAGISVTWKPWSGSGSVSSSTSVTDAQGKASISWTLGATAGSQTMNAVASGIPGVAFTATAEPGALASIQLSPQAPAIKVGETQQFTAAGKDSFGNTVSGLSIQWSSQNTSVATVDSRGVASGVDSGSATLRATADDITGSETLTVNALPAPGAVTNLTIDGSTSSSVTLRWTQVDDGTGAPASYAIRHASSSLDWGAAVSSEQTVSGTGIGSGITFTVKNLQAGTAYEFQVVSYRGSLGSDAVFGPLSNLVGGWTTATSIPAGAHVEATPNSVQFNAVGETAKISAAVIDANGAVLGGYDFSYSSTDTGVVEVDMFGALIARGVGTAMVVVSTLCCDAGAMVQVDVLSQTTGTQHLYEDSFESGDFSYWRDGFSWSGSGESEAVSVQPGYSRSGDQAARFRFFPKPDGGDGWAEKRFSLPKSSKLSVEFWMRVPENYAHRKQSDTEQHKIFAIWGRDYALEGRPKIVAEWWRGDSDSESHWRFLYNPGGSGSSHQAQFGPLATGNPANTWNMTPGSYHQIRIHVEMGTPGLPNGVYRVWIDGVIILDRSDLLHVDGGDPYQYFDAGYLMGYTNAGFAETTDFYIDDFRLLVGHSGW